MREKIYYKKASTIIKKKPHQIHILRQLSYLDKLTNHIGRQNKKKYKFKFSTISILKMKSTKIILKKKS
jgi:hypothetical protein